jgi:DNA-binding MarR family transcriptional regulator
MEWLVLATVSEKSKSKPGHTMSEIATALDVNLSQLNALISRMNTGQLIEQETSTKDKRFKFVRITPKGKELLAEIELTMRDKMRHWLKGIDSDSLAIYIKTVQQLGSVSNRDKSLSK